VHHQNMCTQSRLGHVRLSTLERAGQLPVRVASPVRFREMSKSMSRGMSRNCTRQVWWKFLTRAARSSRSADTITEGSLNWRCSNTLGDGSYALFWLNKCITRGGRQRPRHLVPLRRVRGRATATAVCLRFPLHTATWHTPRPSFTMPHDCRFLVLFLPRKRCTSLNVAHVAGGCVQLHRKCQRR